MLYKEISKDAAVSVLRDKMLAAANCIQFISNEGYIPNKKKYIIVNWCKILTEVIKNTSDLSEEQQLKLTRLYNKVISL